MNNRRSRICLFAGVLAGALLVAAPLARAQSGLPAGLANELRNVAFTAGAMAAEPRIGDSGVRSGETVMAHAVVVAIVQYPRYAALIVREAVALTPAYAPAIVDSAVDAFPSFAAQVRAAVSGGAVAPTMAAPAPVIPPYAAATITPSYERTYENVYAAPVYEPTYQAPASAPMVVADASVQPALAMAPVSDGSGDILDRLGITELWLGGLAHDVGAFGRSKEENFAAIDLGVRFEMLRGEFWDLIAQPRPHAGFHLNVEGDTSKWFGGITWDFDLGSNLFFGADFGLALHDGNLRTSTLDEKELGMRILFREGAELGYRLDGHHAVSLVLDHISNGRLAEANEGLDSFGLRYTWRR
jgi:lipid A 3-O-deacylase